MNLVKALQKNQTMIQIMRTNTPIVSTVTHIIVGAWWYREQGK
jgi:hypothetical protein